MSLDLTNVQKALYDALIAADICDGRVHDGDQGQGQAQAPYVEIGEWDIQADDAQVLEGLDCVATLHIWSKARGAKETQQVADAIRDALHRQPLTITGMDCMDVQVGSTSIQRDPDEIHRHGALRVTIIVSKTEV